MKRAHFCIHYIKMAVCASLSLFVLLSFVGCGADSEHFRIEGRFRNLNQGEFYIYNDDGGSNGLDTIKVSDGRFKYDTELSGKAIFVILFPNFSEQAVFGEEGATVKIAGDASHLKEMEITGTKDNELMAKFRQNVNRLSPPEAIREAASFIKEHPESPISLYILKRYFLHSTNTDYAQAATLLAAMVKASPDNGGLTNLKKQVDRLKNAAVGATIPKFSATSIDGQRISNSTLKAKVNVVNVWASWNYNSQSQQRQLNSIKKEYGSDIAMLGICLDARVADCRDKVSHDSIKFPNVCDGRMWDSPLLGSFGIGTVPGTVLFDGNGKVIARNLYSNKLKEKIETLLKR